MATPQRQRKFKDSCNHCAVAKIKCSKTKPTCTRCEDRGLECEYSPSNRLGRKSASSKPAVSTTPSASSSSVSIPASNVRKKDDGGIPMSITTSDFSLDPYMFPELDLNYQETQLSSFVSMDGLRSDSFASAFCPTPMGTTPVISPQNEFAASSLGSQETWFNSGDPTSFSNFFGLPTPQVPTPPSSHGIGHFLNMNMDTFSGFPDNSGTSCPDTCPSFANRDSNCLAMALYQLGMLHGNPSAQSRPMMGQLPISNKAGQAPTVDDVITSNGISLEMAMAILRCPCSNRNEQLVCLVTLIAFKVLAWYAAAAGEVEGQDGMSPHGPEQVLLVPTTVGKYQLDGSDSSVVRAQLVLGELHRAVQLVEVLSERCGLGEVDVSGNEDCISGFVFAQLAADLRKRLQSVIKDTMAIIHHA